MPDQQNLRAVCNYTLDYIVVRQWAKFRVKELYIVASVNQRPADRKQAKRRQLFPRDAATDCNMRWIEQQNAHEDLEP